MTLQGTWRGLALIVLAGMAPGAGAQLHFPAGPLQATGPVQKSGAGGSTTKVQVDLAGLAAGRAGDRVALPGNDGRPVPARVLSVRRRDDGLLAWTARVDTEAGPRTAIIVAGDGPVFGHLPQRGGRTLLLDSFGSQPWLVDPGEAVPVMPTGDDALLPPLPDAASRAKRAAQDARPRATGPTVDLLVLYTPRLVQAWGSDAAARTRIALLEEATNQSFTDSQADLAIRVVATHLVDHNARDDNSEALQLMTLGVGSALHAEAARLRALYGADLVKLVREFDPHTQSSCGNGWRGGSHGGAWEPEYGFSITIDRGFGDNRCLENTFAHEIGHNLGAHHDIETTGGAHGAFPYSRGYRRWVGQGGFFTIMAYPAARLDLVMRWSNPRQLCAGEPCGDAAEADNARGIGQAAGTVAAYFQPPARQGPGVVIEDVAVTEGRDGLRPARFVVRLDGPAPAGGSTVGVATQPGSADEDDFVPLATTVHIPAGQSATHVDVLVRGDGRVEVDETFALNVVSVANAHVLDGQGVATILNDEATPTLDLGDAVLTEGDAGTLDMVFTARLSAPSTEPVWLHVQTHDYEGALGLATPGVDFEPMTYRDLVIPPGRDYVQFVVPIKGDLQPEQMETFVVSASDVRGAIAGRVAAQGRILDNDGGSPSPPALTVSDVVVQEGDDGTREAVFTVRLLGGGAAPAGFGLATRDGTALAGADYHARAFTTLRLTGATPTLTVSVPVVGDTRAEGDETFELVINNISGAVAAKAVGVATIQDDDGPSAGGVLQARDDRYELLENAAAPAHLPVLANDVFDAAGLAGGSLAISRHPTGGSAFVDTGGSPASAADDAIRYTPAPGVVGEDSLAYRLCEASGRCTEGQVRLLLRPFPAQAIESPAGAGFHDVAVAGLGALPSLRLRMLPAARRQAVQLALAADPTPETPWDMARAGTAVQLFLVPALPAPGNPGSAAVDTPVRLLAEASGIAGTDVDLYLGVDANANGQPDPGELACVAAVSGLRERCELDLVAPAPGGLHAWAMVHSPDGSAASAQLDIAAFLPGHDAAEGMAATGPGQVPAGAGLPVRLSWDDPGRPPGEAWLGLVELRATPDAPPRHVPLRIDRSGVEPGAASLLHHEAVWLDAGQRAGELYLDVPEGATRLVVELFPEAPVDVYLAPAGAAAGPAIGPPPPAAQARVSRPNAVRGDLLVVEGAQLVPGRWYLVPVDKGAGPARFAARARLEGPMRLPRTGSYYNPDRGGHGLFFYPAGGQWAGLWYTYLQDGSPTWYYLQADAPAPGDAGWSGPVYRAAWNGTGNTLARVGQASLTALAGDEAIFSYRLDGQAGSERVAAFGAGCPTLGGAVLDASSHWFDPAYAGTGYSVQLFPDYEFHAAFVYDALGVPRFLTAEAGAFLGAEATLPLEQLAGFCPLCERTGPPRRTDIGTLRRRFDAGGLVRMELDAILADGVPGAWSGDHRVQLLGGPGTTQGCPAP